jgi:prepilin-type N-terminal cleavage/methylation domain-containing protein
MAVKLLKDPGSSPGRRRRGVTLVEMLVTLAVLLVLMTIIVQIFGAATGSLSGAQAYQELDNKLRQLDVTIRSDLQGVTASFTPPLDPKDNKGYFEYGENSFADQQGEDSDDYLKFTAKAPDGRPFVGRFWPKYIDTNPNSSTFGTQMAHPNGPITITSQFAEIVYFLRNGNLYRRVFLIAPERQSSIVQMVSTTAFNNAAYFNNGINHFFYLLNGQRVSWQGVNDLSARPAPNGTIATGAIAKTEPASIILNTLGDLTNRENRAFAPRLGNDFQTIPGTPTPDNRVDDFNPDNNGNPVGNGVPDFYPTLYPHVFSVIGNTSALIYDLSLDTKGNFATNTPLRLAYTTDTMAFPYIFPGAYSMPEPGDSAQTGGTYGNGWIHSPNPDSHNPFDQASGLNYLRRLNHSPLDQGDNLPRPGPLPSQAPANTAFQTWWGFPTWRETLSPNWTDPTAQVNDYVNNPNGQPNGLHPRAADSLGNDFRVPPNDGNLLPPMTLTANFTVNSATSSYPVRLVEQPFTDGWGRDGSQNNVSLFWNPALWNTTWEDDLIATGVRSFDVKAYDASIGQYVDLGWGDDLRFAPNYVPGPAASNGLPIPSAYPNWPPPYLYENFDFKTWNINGGRNVPAYLFTNGTYFDLLNQTMAHEGRMPPLFADNRLDAQYPNPTYINWRAGGYTPQYSSEPNYTSNIGDNNPATIRLRRVWDTWSTTYTKVPATSIDPNTGSPIGPTGANPTPPVYPSYPPPYPAPLRGLQIQIRVTDAVGQHIKVLTIRQDFTDKL